MRNVDRVERWAVEAIYEALGPPRLRYCPWTPTAKQEAFLLLPQLEAFFGGAAGPGKSVALLIASLMYCDVPGYDALLLRPTLAELEQPGALIDLSHEFLDGGDASWVGERRRWSFPSGATLSFGYLADDNDVARYHGTSYSFLGFDELTQFSELQYRRMRRVLRQPNNSEGQFAVAADGTRLQDVPVRIRAASNPGGPGHQWVRARFVDPITRVPGIGFLPARFRDNPHLDAATYEQLLAELPSLDRARLLDGDWDVSEEGEAFRREWFRLVSAAEVEPAVKSVRYWDLAASEPSQRNRDPDHTVGLRLDRDRRGIFTISDIVRGRWNAAGVEQAVLTTAKNDGARVPIFIEQEPGAAGKLLLDHYRRRVLSGYIVHPGLPGGANKELRARPVAAAASYGLVQMLPNPNLHAFLDEIAIFPNGAHDDIVDALSGAHTALTKTGKPFPFREVNKIEPQPEPDRAAGHSTIARVASNAPLSDREAADLAARIGIGVYNPQHWQI